jgi:hypothetical protein
MKKLAIYILAALVAGAILLLGSQELREAVLAIFSADMQGRVSQSALAVSAKMVLRSHLRAEG